MHNQSRLNIWVCEFVSGGGLSQASLPNSMLQEGVLMRDALLADLHAIGVHSITSHDRRVPAPVFGRSQLITEHCNDLMAYWSEHIRNEAVDACWVIAPESDAILQHLHTMVAASGKRWIGCDATAIRLTSDKRAMALHCAQFGIPVIPQQCLTDVDLASLTHNNVAEGWIIKPVDGAGCEHTYYFSQAQQVIDFKSKQASHDLVARMMVQPYIRGQALSFSAIATPQAVKVIAGHRQCIRITDHVLRFAGAGVNAAEAVLPAMQMLAEHIKKVLPGLTGYWGADVILQDDGQLVLVEINPRLTTPYIALSKLLQSNPAQMILDAVLHARLPDSTAQGSHALVLDTLTALGGAQAL